MNVIRDANEEDFGRARKRDLRKRKQKKTLKRSGSRRCFQGGWKGSDTMLVNMVCQGKMREKLETIEN